MKIFMYCLKKKWSCSSHSAIMEGKWALWFNRFNIVFIPLFSIFVVYLIIGNNTKWGRVVLVVCLGMIVWFYIVMIMKSYLKNKNRIKVLKSKSSSPKEKFVAANELLDNKEIEADAKTLQLIISLTLPSSPLNDKALDRISILYDKELVPV